MIKNRLFSDPVRIALIGFRGIGKSTVGKLLAKKLRMRYVSLDSYITSKAGQTIEEIVQKKGWPAFREMEFEVLNLLSNRPNILLDTGGGVLENEKGELSQKKSRLLKNCYYCVYLYMNDDMILKRLNTSKKSSHRPGLNGDIRDVLAKRKPWYESVAHFALNIERMTPGDIVRHILKQLKHVG